MDGGPLTPELTDGGVTLLDPVPHRHHQLPADLRGTSTGLVGRLQPQAKGRFGVRDRALGARPGQRPHGLCHRMLRGDPFGSVDGAREVAGEQLRAGDVAGEPLHIGGRLGEPLPRRSVLVEPAVSPRDPLEVVTPGVLTEELDRLMGEANPPADSLIRLPPHCHAINLTTTAGSGTCAQGCEIPVKVGANRGEEN
ncbi:hypothetical protein HJ590_14400 [Naumannella sp. ID2617S]|nr:hypothetical protein [Naumannella sp. ID2617S]